MNKISIIKSFFILLLIGFFMLLFAESSGFYKTKESKAKILTEEQIKQFEMDIEAGKAVDITEYVVDIEKDYTSKLSDNLYKVSLKLEKGIDKTIKYVFRKVNNMIEE